MMINVKYQIIIISIYFVVIVYCLRTKNFRFVAPMPEQVGTPTMHFPDVPGDTCQKTLRKCIVVVAICSGMGATNFIFMASTDFSR